MTQNKQGVYRYLLLALIVIGAIVWLIPAPEHSQTSQDKDRAEEKTAEDKPVAAGPKREVTLFRINKNGDSLAKTAQSINASLRLEEQVITTLKYLFAEDSAATPVFPSGMLVREVYVYEKVVVVSLGGEFRSKLNSGIWTELLALYSIVNTLTESFEEIDSAQILIDDMESGFFINHVSIDGIIEPDLSFVGDTPENG